MVRSAHLRVAFVGALSLLAVASTSALACKGQTSLLRDDFTDEDPAWGIEDVKGVTIGDGSMKITTDPNSVLHMSYGGANFPAGDACVDIVAPPAFVKDVTFGGLGLWTARGWVFIQINSDATAEVAGVQNGIWVYPVPARKFDAIKAGPGATNNLRVVWKGPPAQDSNDAPDPNVMVYINGKLFVKFKTPPNADRSLAMTAQTEGTTYQFKNLNVTQ